jgi:hypothetical protein
MDEWCGQGFEERRCRQLENKGTRMWWLEKMFADYTMSNPVDSILHSHRYNDLIFFKLISCCWLQNALRHGQIMTQPQRYFGQSIAASVCERDLILLLAISKLHVFTAVTMNYDMDQLRFLPAA